MTPLLLLYVFFVEPFLSSAAQECIFNVELVIVQDVSSGASGEKQQELADELGKMAEKLHERYPSLRLGLSTFVDKPIAYLGWSNEYGGHTTPGTSDWCYRKESALTTDYEGFADVLRKAATGAGVDIPEAQYEAILRAALDSSLGWSDPSVEYLEDGSTPLRIMVLLTDNSMHLMGEGQKSLDLWANQYATQEWCDMPVIGDKTLCAESIQLKPVIDSGAATQEQQDRWTYIQSVLGPRTFPPMKTHPGNLIDNEGCTEYDYPDWPYMVSVLEERKINPIYALISENDNTAYNNWKWLSEQYVDAKISCEFLYQPSIQDIGTLLDTMVGTLGDNWCKSLPDPPTTTEAETTAERETSEAQVETTEVETITETQSTEIESDTETTEVETPEVETEQIESTDAETEVTEITTTEAESDTTEVETTEVETEATNLETTEAAPQTTDAESMTSREYQQCAFNIEFTIVMDVSSSEVTQDDLPFLADSILSLSTVLRGKYPSLRMGLTTFVDKPIAYLGYSSEYGGHPDFPTDWCYRQVMPLTQDFVSLTDSIREMVIGGGADPKEAQYEGILRTALDTSLGWTNASVNWLDDGTIPLRIIFMMTDSAMHLMGDGPASLEKWANEYGTQAWCDEPIISDKELCAEAVALKPLIDNGSATQEELDRWAYIQTVLGPVEFPPMKVHPGNLTGNDGCTEYDYPDWPYVVDVLEKNQINPIYLLYSEDEDVIAGWQWIADQYQSVSSHFFYNVEISDITQLLEHVIDEIGVSRCRALSVSQYEKD